MLKLGAHTMGSDDFSQTSKLNYVFVYGTLKENEPNHHWLSKNEGDYCKLLCKAQTMKKYPLIIATQYNIPFILYKPGIGYHVKGDVYEVNDAVLASLDILEEHPNFYIREEDMVQNLDTSGKILKVWIYFIKNFKPVLLESEMFEEYSSNGSHGLKYVPSETSTLDDLNN